jgi:hypothetical protein
MIYFISGVKIPERVNNNRRVSFSPGPICINMLDCKSAESKNGKIRTGYRFLIGREAAKQDPV